MELLMVVDKDNAVPADMYDTDKCSLSLSTYFVLYTVLKFIFINTFNAYKNSRRRYYYYPHFMDEKTKKQRSSVTCPRSHHQRIQATRCNPNVC